MYVVNCHRSLHVYYTHPQQFNSTFTCNHTWFNHIVCKEICYRNGRFRSDYVVVKKKNNKKQTPQKRANFWQQPLNRQKLHICKSHGISLFSLWNTDTLLCVLCMYIYNNSLLYNGNSSLRNFSQTSPWIHKRNKELENT